MRFPAPACMLLACLFAFGADWPEFRGPSGQGVVSEAHAPLELTDRKNILWDTDVPGKGFSSPVVMGDQVWLTTSIDTEATPEQIEQQFAESGLDAEKFKRRQVAGSVSLRAVCYDRATGKLLRNVEVFRVESPRAIHVGNSYASPSPVIEPGRLYCHFDAGTACVDTETGETLWQRVIPAFYSVGAGSSPILYNDLLILVCDGIDTQFVIALDKRTGETVWKTSRPPFRNDDGQRRKAFSTPLVIRHQGREQMVVPGAQWITSYDPSTGEELWRVDHGSGFSNVARPVFGNGLVYVCTGFSSGEVWAIRVDGEGDVSDTHVAWRQHRLAPIKPSPLLVGDSLFMVSDTGIASCLDASTGETVWKKRIGGNYSASPVCIGERIYFASHEGNVTVVAASREFELLAENELPAPIMGSPAVLPSMMLIRAGSKLYAFR